MSGVIVERRDQVLMTLRSPAAFIASTFFWRWSSTNGPFFRLRGIVTSAPRGPGAPAELAARARLQLHVVDHGADGDVAQRQRVARPDLGTLATLEQVADLHAARGDDVALLAVEVVEQRDARVAVRVVLDRRDLGGHAVLVAPEVHEAVLLLVPAAA